MEHECVYGVTLEGHEITETLLSGNIDFPIEDIIGDPHYKVITSEKGED